MFGQRVSNRVSSREPGLKFPQGTTDTSNVISTTCIHSRRWLRNWVFPVKFINLFFLGTVAGFGQQSSTGPAALYDMDIETLLNTNVTTASKFTEKASSAASVVTVVTQDELQRFGGVTLLKVLERVAGLSISSAFLGDTGMITVRGDQSRANSGHILILINGRPVREILAGGTNSDILEAFPIRI